VPWLTIPALVITLFGLAYEWLRTEHTINVLARKLTEDVETTKIEVREGRWASLQYALNRMLQQRRTQQHVQALLPNIPTGAADISAAQIPPEGLPRYLVVLALSLQTTNMTVWHELSRLIARKAEEHTAFIDWNSSVILMAFGAFADQERTELIRTALHVARQIHHNVAFPMLTMAMAAGESRITVLPGLGYTLMGSPLEQVTTLCAHGTMVRNRQLLLCNEELYLMLRHLGSLPAPPTTLKLENTIPTVYAVTLS
jgi:hypothetical protein